MLDDGLLALDRRSPALNSLLYAVTNLALFVKSNAYYMLSGRWTFTLVRGTTSHLAGTGGAAPQS